MNDTIDWEAVQDLLADVRRRLAQARGLLPLDPDGAGRELAVAERLLALIATIRAGPRAAEDLDAPAASGIDLPYLPEFEPLTAREMEVLRLLAAGLRNKEIAVQIGVSERTATFHVGNVLAKLGADSRTEAVYFARRRGLVRD